MLGDKIRELRKNRNLSISGLSARAGVSDSYISQLERNIIDPSVSVLKRIAVILEVPISTFFDEDYEEPFVIRKDAYVSCPSLSEGFRLERISPASSDWGNQMEIQMFQLSPKMPEQSLLRSGELCIHILKGTAQITLEQTTQILKKGDSIYISPHVTFMLSNPGTGPLSGMLCSTVSQKKEDF